jgi:hypothetical protein
VLIVRRLYKSFGVKGLRLRRKIMDTFHVCNSVVICPA